MTNNRSSRKWSLEEDQVLLRYIRARPQNLHACFLAVSEQINRTPCAVEAHWYSVLSNKPEALCFFTASSKHVSKNRKNSMGVESTPSIWRRLLDIIRNI